MMALDSAEAAIEIGKPKDVMCGATKCGVLEIDKYQESSGNSTQPVTGFLGIDINGLFKPVGAIVSKTFNFIQAITNYNSSDRRWINDTSVPIGVPFIDPPPGGYKVKSPWNAVNWTVEQKFDYKPYYQPAGPAFPNFGDTPGMYMLPAKDNKLVFNFETWLVCTIEEMMGTNVNTSKDDNYTVAPLLGFTWGFDIAFKDQGVIGTDELQDFSVTLNDADWIIAPSDSWKNALATKYGAGANQDFFNVKLGQCENCQEVPAPLPILGLGISFGYIRKLRSMSKIVKGQG